MSRLFPGLPIFLDLVGRAVVVAAADRAAHQLAQECLACGAGVRMIHPEAKADAAPGLHVTARRWRAADFRDVTLVAVGGDERRLTQARTSAKAARAMFMILDGGPGSDLAPAETTAHGAVTVGVSIIGLPEPLATTLRGRVAAAAPSGLNGFFDAAAALGRVHGADSVAEKRFWDEAFTAALTAKPCCWRTWLAARAAQRSISAA